MYQKRRGFVESAIDLVILSHMPLNCRVKSDSMFCRVLLLLAITYGVGWPQVARDQNSSGNNKTQKTDKGQRIVPPTHVVIDPPIPTVNISQPPAKPAQTKTEDKPPPWFQQATKPEWVIVYVTAVYVFFTWRMLKAIKGQAGTMEWQANLMQNQIFEAAESNKTTTALAHGTLAAMEAQALAMGRQIDVSEQHGKEGKEANTATLSAIVRQADLMAKQAELTARQIDLQERTMQQWVDYGNWRSEYRANDDGRQLLVFNFDLLNPTNFPITLPDASIVFEFNGMARRVEPRTECRLLPNRPHPITGWFPLTNEEAEVYANGLGIYIRVSALIPHIGSLGRTCNQVFCGLLVCHERFTRFEEETPQEQDQRPN